MSKRIDLTTLGQRGSSRGPLESSAIRAESLYIHVPFCFHKCHYCDFYSFVDTRDRQADYVSALIAELRMFAVHSGSRRPRLRTIFVGGGTPSLLRTELWAQLLGALDGHFDLSPIRAPGAGAPEAEFTVECNPETVTPELMRVLAAGGVTRVSIGAQSFHPSHLRMLERWHDPANVARALELAAGAGIRRRNLDLIFAIPGQTMEEWMRDLDTALALRLPGGAPAVDHLSCYALTYEPNTPMTKRLERGEFTRAEEDLEAAMYAAAVERLSREGFARYEVSNFARPGAASLHNLVYWRHGEWLAAGPSASAHLGGWRWKNVPRLGDWMEGVAASGGYSPVVDLEPPDPRRALAERLMMGLRLAEGVSIDGIMRESEPLGAAEPLRRAAAREIERGRLLDAGGRWRLTDEGFLFADGIASEFMQRVSHAAPGDAEGPTHARR